MPGHGRVCRREHLDRRAFALMPFEERAHPYQEHWVAVTETPQIERPLSRASRQREVAVQPPPAPARDPNWSIPVMLITLQPVGDAAELAEIGILGPTGRPRRARSVRWPSPNRPCCSLFLDGRCWVRTSDLLLVRQAATLRL